MAETSPVGWLDYAGLEVIAMGLPDICVVGAGPAGLACAIAAAQRGMRVRVVDAAREGPLDKACGEGLLPNAVRCLERMGVCGLGGHRLAGIRFHGAGKVAAARFGGAHGLGIRRTELHRAMLERAASLGVVVEWGFALRELSDVRAGHVVGADGGQSRVRALAGLEGRVTSRRVGLRQHFGARPWSEFVEVYWGNGAQAYVTPVDEGQVGVAFLSSRKFSSVAAALAEFPALREKLAGAMATSAARGAVTVTRRLGRVTAGRVALVGDASGSVDAITGEGMNLCFRQAEVLVEAMEAGDSARYEVAHPATLRGARCMSSALLRMSESRVVRAGAMAMLAGVPGVFRGLLALHVGEWPKSGAAFLKMDRRYAHLSDDTTVAKMGHPPVPLRNLL